VKEKQSVNKPLDLRTKAVRQHFFINGLDWVQEVCWLFINMEEVRSTPKSKRSKTKEGNSYSTHFNGETLETPTRLKVDHNSGSMTGSVQEFLKQSAEIQSEIKKISDLFYQLSPEQGEIEENSDESKLEEESSGVMWKEINHLLMNYGFNSVSLASSGEPDPTSLADTLVDLLYAYKDQQQVLKETREELEASIQEIKDQKLQKSDFEKKSNTYLESQLREFEKKTKHLNYQLKKFKSSNNKKDCKISELENKLDNLETLKSLSQILTEKTKHRNTAIFKNLLNKEYDPSSGQDLKVMTLIKLYEKEFKNYQEQIKELNKELENFYKQNYYSSEEDENSDLVLQKLEVKSVPEALEAIEKIQAVVREVPSLERFIEEVCAEVLSDKPKSMYRVDAVVPTIAELKSELSDLRNLRIDLCEAFGAKEAFDSDLVEKARALAHFRRLFQIQSQKEVTVMDNVFLFVHEIKMFLQYARRALGSSESKPLNLLLQEISERL